MSKHRNISAMERARHRQVGRYVVHQTAWGLEMALAAQECALVKAESATKEKI